MQQGSQTAEIGATAAAAPAPTDYDRAAARTCLPGYDLVTSFPGHERPLGWFENAVRSGFRDEGWT